MAHQEASRSKYIVAFFVANFASRIAAILGDDIFSASDYFNSAIRTGEVEQGLFAGIAISGLSAAATWIAVFLMFKNIYFQRMLWYVIAGNVFGSLLGMGALSRMQNLLGLTDTFLFLSALFIFAIAMTVPLFFYVLRKDRYYPPVFAIRNEGVLSGDGPKAAPANLNSSSIQHEPSLTQTAEPADEEMYEIALNELDNDKQVSAIYAKALALSQGDTDKARWKYVDLRVGRLKEQEAKGANLVSCKDCGVSEPSERLTDGLCVDCIGFRATRLEAEEALEKLKAKLQHCKVCGVNELSETLTDGVCVTCSGLKKLPSAINLKQLGAEERQEEDFGGSKSAATIALTIGVAILVGMALSID